MNSSEYRTKAARALRLAKALGPGADADRLKMLSADYERRAAELEASPGGMQQQQPQPETKDCSGVTTRQSHGAPPDQHEVGVPRFAMK
jgi:hypothetical protein